MLFTQEAPACVSLAQALASPRPLTICHQLRAFPLLFLAINWVSRAQKARGAPALERTLGYHVWYFPENTTNLTETVNTTHQPLELTLGAEAYRVSVVAYNSLGQGPATALRIPAAAEEGESCVTSCRDAAVQGARAPPVATEERPRGSGGRSGIC